MPHTCPNPAARLDQRIGRAILLGRDDEGVIAVEQGRIVACTQHAAELLLCDAAAALGASAVAFIDGLEGELLRLHLRSALLDESAVEFVVARPGAEDGWIEVRSLPLAPGISFLFKDVTDRELSERSLRRKEQRLLAANRSLRLAHTAARAAGWEWRSGGSLRWLDLAAARELGVCRPPGPRTRRSRLAQPDAAARAAGVRPRDEGAAGGWHGDLRDGGGRRRCGPARAAN